MSFVKIYYQIDATNLHRLGDTLGPGANHTNSTHTGSGLGFNSALPALETPQALNSTKPYLQGQGDRARAARNDEGYDCVLWNFPLAQNDGVLQSTTQSYFQTNRDLLKGFFTSVQQCTYYPLPEEKDLNTLHKHKKSPFFL